jgi:hypothetical protein
LPLASVFQTTTNPFYYLKKNVNHKLFIYNCVWKKKTPLTMSPVMSRVPFELQHIELTVVWWMPMNDSSRFELSFHVVISPPSQQVIRIFFFGCHIKLTG